jgi:hypothetical protein
MRSTYRSLVGIGRRALTLSLYFFVSVLLLSSDPCLPLRRQDYLACLNQLSDGFNVGPLHVVERPTPNRVALYYQSRLPQDLFFSWGWSLSLPEVPSHIGQNPEYQAYAQHKLANFLVQLRSRFHLAMLIQRMLVLAMRENLGGVFALHRGTQ